MTAKEIIKTIDAVLDADNCSLQKAKYLRQSAIHEACHFVALMSRGYYCEAIEINEAGGIVSGLSHPKTDRTLGQQLADESILCLAGHTGEEIYKGQSLAIGGSESDYSFIMQKYKAIGLTDAKAWQQAQSFKQITKALLIANWSKVEKIANKLQSVKKLTFNQAAYL